MKAAHATHIPLILLLFLLALSALAPAQAATQHYTVHTVYVAIGDSLTEGDGTDDPTTQSYPALLAHHLPHGARYLNLASAGNMLSSAVIFDLPATLAAHPTLVTVWLGVPDLN